MNKVILRMAACLALIGFGAVDAQTGAQGSGAQGSGAQGSGAQGSGAQGERFALVIGNGGYTGMTALKNPVNDARDVAAVLGKTGCAVDLLLDADLDSMEAGVNRLAASLKANPGRVGFFYYAGHGVQSNGENYLIPIGAQISGEAFLRSKALSAQAVLDALQMAGNSLNVVILDACRDNPFGWNRSASRGLSAVASQPPGSIIVYATSAGTAAQDGDGRNGLFTGELLKHLGSPGLDIAEVFRRTGSGVRIRSRGAQVPAVYSQYFDDFSLAGKVPTIDPAATGTRDSTAASAASAKAVASAAPAEPVELLLQVMTDNMYPESYWQTIVRAYEADHPTVTIKLVAIPVEKYDAEIGKPIDYGRVPDIAEMSPAYGLRPWEAQGLLCDLNPWLDGAYYDMSQMPPQGAAGERYYVPSGSPKITSVLYVNASLLKSRGLAVPRTYEDLVALSASLKKTGLVAVAFAGKESWTWSSCILSGLVGRYTGDTEWVRNALEGRKRFDDPSFISALEALKKMRTDGIFGPSVMKTDYKASLELFRSGKALCMIDGSWRAGELGDIQFETELYPLPVLPGQSDAMAGSVSAIQTSGLGLTKKAASDPAKRMAALDFIDFFNNDANVIARWRSGQITGPVRMSFPLPDDLPPILKQRLALIRNSQTITNVIDAYLPPNLNDPLNVDITNLLSGKTTARAIAEKLEKAARKK